MALTEARKRANKKWDAENMQIVACKVKKSTASDFKELAKANGTTPNELLRNFIQDYIKEKAAED